MGKVFPQIFKESEKNMSIKGFTVGTYIIKAEKKDSDLQQALLVKNVKTNLFVKIEKTKKK